MEMLADLCQQYPQVLKSVRGAGLMIGVECVTPNTELLAKVRELGLLVGKAGGNMIRLLPPINVSEAHIERAVGIIEQAVVATQKELES